MRAGERSAANATRGEYRVDSSERSAASGERGADAGVEARRRAARVEGGAVRRVVVANRRDTGWWWRLPLCALIWLAIATPIGVAIAVTATLRGWARDLPEVPDLAAWRAHAPRRRACSRQMARAWPSCRSRMDRPWGTGRWCRSRSCRGTW